MTPPASTRQFLAPLSDYGQLSPSPLCFAKESWKLAKGESLRLRDRVAMPAGTPQEAGLDTLDQQWLHA